LILLKTCSSIIDKLKKIKINVSEKIDQYVFADILKLSVKMKKKRKRVKKKKVKHLKNFLSDSKVLIFRNDRFVHIHIYFLLIKKRKKNK